MLISAREPIGIRCSRLTSMRTEIIVTTDSPDNHAAGQLMSRRCSKITLILCALLPGCLQINRPPRDLANREVSRPARFVRWYVLLLLQHRLVFTMPSIIHLLWLPESPQRQCSASVPAAGRAVAVDIPDCCRRSRLFRDCLPRPESLAGDRSHCLA